MSDTSAEAVERAVKKLTRLGQIGRESAANSLPITGVTNRDGLNIAATLHALLIERDTYRRELQATSQQADMLMAALTEWRDEPPGGISKGGVLYLSPERVAAQVEAARREEREANAAVALGLRDAWRNGHGQRNGVAYAEAIAAAIRAQDDNMTSEQMEAQGWRYLGPCLLAYEVNAPVAKEREACAATAEREMRELFGDADEYQQGWNAGLEAGAAAIRARGDA
jgi:hypothetical protein